MTLPSQFSLEEENFYKDIQDLLKNSSQNEKELSSFLQRYMDLLAKADLDDESLIINFTKAGLIIEASAKVYGTKVDRLWNNLEHVLMSLRSKSQGQSKNKTLAGEEMEMEGDETKRRLSVNSRRRKKVGDAIVSVDDFVEIDNITGLLGKNMNEDISRGPGSLKFCEKVPNMFIKNKQRKKKIDVCLNKNVEEKDIIRLRDWVVSTECLLVKEIYTSIPEDNSTNNINNESLGLRREVFDLVVFNKSHNTTVEDTETGGEEVAENSVVQLLPKGTPKEDLKNKSLNTEVEPNLSLCIEPATEYYIPPSDKNIDFPTDRNSIENDLNISRESDLAKFPNVLGRGPKACLVDVDEVFWDAEKFRDMIPNRKLRSGKAYKTLNPPCKLCKKKEAHQGKKPGRRCVNKKRKESGLDTYFIPHVQPTIGEPQFGILPDEELISTFKQENKIIEQLAKVNAARNINEAFHPDENPEELKNFLGFEGFERRFIRISECNEDEVEAEFDDHNSGDELNFADNPPLGEDFELPVPVTLDSVTYKIVRTECVSGSKDDDRLAESEYQKLLKEGLKDHYEAKSIFAKNKKLGIKISKWHEMISDKIRLSEERGAMNMKLLANKIMASFPSTLRGELPQMSFRELVKNQCRRDIPRYFFGCLQLTNEGNLNISRTDPRPLATDCMVITQLRSMRKNCELDESTAKSPTKETKTPEGNKKRNLLMRSPVTFESKSLSKTKRVKQRTEKAYKRQKNFTALNNSKKISHEPEETAEICTEQPTEWIEYEKEIEFDEAINENENREAVNPKRPKNVSMKNASDIFQDIDFNVNLSEKNINEIPDERLEKLKFYDNVFKIFVRNQKGKKRDIEDEKVIRLREWILTIECLLVKEICPSVPEYYGETYEEEIVLAEKDIVIDSSGVTEIQSIIKKMGLEGLEDSDFFEFSNYGEKTEIDEIYAYMSKLCSNCKSEPLIPVEQNPVSYVLVQKNNDAGPSDTNTVQLKMRTACTRQENFTVSCPPKKRKI